MRSSLIPYGAEEAERARAQENRITLEVPAYLDRPAERAPEVDEDRGPIVIPLYPEDDKAEDAA